MKPDNAPIRQEKRYSHITIGLQYRNGDAWHTIQALDWHQRGFNFYSDSAISEPTIRFRKGILHFDGIMLWHRKNEDDALICERLLNEALFKQIKTLAATRETAHRIANLIRTGGKIAEKKKLLAHSGMEFGTEEEIAEKIASFKKKYPVWRYGIKTEAAEWQHIVAVALETSSVVLALERVNQRLSGTGT